jgi:replicative DNA helicase
MGKTAFALNMARNAAIEGEVPVAVFSLEMSKEQLSMRMLCAEARVDSSRIRSGFLNQEDWNRITDAADRLTAAPLLSMIHRIFPPHPSAPNPCA